MDGLVWKPGREAGLAALEAFLPELEHYAARRNFDYGPLAHKNVSRLSPYLRHRLISEQEVCRAALQAYPLAKIEKFIQEVCWRSYWKGWLQMRPGVWADYRSDVARQMQRLSTEPALMSDYRAATQGQTRIDCFDFWVNELKTTGYLHNHARMWFASIWIFTLRLPWSLGADFFMAHLLDGDSASNTLSWRWVGGLQTMGKHYIARAENIEKFTGGRFSPKGLNETPDPLKIEHSPYEMTDPFFGFDEKVGDVDPSHCLFLLHEDDLSLYDHNRADTPHCLMIDSTASRSAMAVSDKVLDFVRRSAPRVPVVKSFGEIADYADTHALQYVIAARPPVGPVYDVMKPGNKSEDQLSRRLKVLTHPWDRLAWPKATKGFFAFRKHIPELLDSFCG